MIFSFSIFQAHTHHLFSITSLRSVPILTVVSYTTYYDDFFYLTFSKQIFGGTDDDGCGTCLYLYLSFFPALKIHTKKCLFIYKCTYYYHLNFCHENESHKKNATKKWEEKIIDIFMMECRIWVTIVVVVFVWVCYKSNVSWAFE